MSEPRLLQERKRQAAEQYVTRKRGRFSARFSPSVIPIDNGVCQEKPFRTL